MNKWQKLVQQEFLNNEEKVIRRLEVVYSRAAKDINDKIKNLELNIDGLIQKHVWMDDADPNKEKVKSQIQSKIYQKKYQQALQDQVEGILDQLHTSGYLTIADYLNECYTDSFIGSLFDLHGQKIPLMIPLDQTKMVRAVQLNSKISQGLYNRLGEDVDLLKKKITAQVSRSVANGTSYGETARQLAMQSRIGYNNAIRIARTEGHRIQTTAAMDVMEQAKEKGADVVKQWDAALDGRTRASHRAVDGEIREVEEKFSNGLMYPGDPSGGAKEVINCRCALLQRARWALDEQELEHLKERANFWGLDKSESFKDFKQKYLKAVNSDEMLPINIQLFGGNPDKYELLDKIEKGFVSKTEFEKCYRYFKEQMDAGVVTPIETVYDKGDRYYHIVNHHEYMLGKQNIDKIIKVLKAPECIYETTDRFGNIGLCYVEKTEAQPLIVITRNGIITAYKPGKNYLAKIRKGARLWRES